MTLNAELVGVKTLRKSEPALIQFQIKLSWTNPDQWTVIGYAGQITAEIGSKYAFVGCLNFWPTHLVINGSQLQTIHPILELYRPRLHDIETVRSGGALPLNISLTVQGWEGLVRGNPTVKILGVNSPNGAGVCRVEASQWADILREIGYPSFVTEGTDQVLEPQLSRAAEFLDSAKTRFRQGAWGPTLDDCKHVLEEIERVANMKKSPHPRKIDLGGILGSEKAESLDLFGRQFVDGDGFLNLSEHRARATLVTIGMEDAEFALRVTSAYLTHISSAIKSTSQ